MDSASSYHQNSYDSQKSDSPICSEPDRKEGLDEKSATKMDQRTLLFDQSFEIHSSRQNIENSMISHQNHVPDSVLRGKKEELDPEKVESLFKREDSHDQCTVIPSGQDGFSEEFTRLRNFVYAYEPAMIRTVVLNETSGEYEYIGNNEGSDDFDDEA